MTRDVVDVDHAVELLRILSYEMVAKNEVGQGTGERGSGEEYRTPADPLGTVSLASEVGHQEGRADLTDLGGRHYQTRGLRLDLKQLLYRRDHRNEVREVHSLEYLRRGRTRVSR